MQSQEREEKRQTAIRRLKQELAPVMKDLHGAGYEFPTIDDLRRSGKKYTGAVPILLFWLNKVNSTDAKEALVRALSVPWAKPDAGPILICEFEKQHEGEPHEDVHKLRWAIGNALEVLADQTLASKMTELALRTKYGTARQMIVLGLAKVRDPKVVQTLITLLDDQDVAGHAVMALGKLRSANALRSLERLADHPQSWIRAEVKKAVGRITKEHPTSLH